MPIRCCYRGLRIYYKSLKGSAKLFSCPHCGLTMTPKKFEKHCSENHSFLNPKFGCVWCLGIECWQKGLKYKHTNHLIACFRKFIKLNAHTRRKKPLPQEDDIAAAAAAAAPSIHHPDPIPFNTTPMYPKQECFDHEFEPPERAFDILWPQTLDPNPLPFQDESLNKAVSCVRKYLEIADQVDYFHLMVRTVAYPQFLKTIDEDAGQTQMLPFSCWCNGGYLNKAHFRQHRHVIITSSPKGYFQRNVLKQITTEDRPYKGFKCHHCEPIVSAMHFVNTLGYLSKRTSKCKFTSHHKTSISENLNHFYFSESLPKDYRLLLITDIL